MLLQNPAASLRLLFQDKVSVQREQLLHPLAIDTEVCISCRLLSRLSNGLRKSRWIAAAYPVHRKARPDPSLCGGLTPCGNPDQIKQRKDSIADFEKANREDLVEKETGEVTILKQYLPKPFSEAELKALIQKAVQTVGAKTKADMGKVMKEVMPQVTGKADGNLGAHDARRSHDFQYRQ